MSLRRIVAHVRLEIGSPLLRAEIASTFRGGDTTLLTVPKEDQIMSRQMNGLNARLLIGLALGIWLAAGTLSGCRKERVVDVQTPIGDVQVDKDKVNGDVEVKVDTD
jgi:hypothetical protein